MGVASAWAARLVSSAVALTGLAAVLVRAVPVLVALALAGVCLLSTSVAFDFATVVVLPLSATEAAVLPPGLALVLIDVETSDGVVCHAYLFCYTPMVLPALASLVSELGAAVVGTSDAPPPRGVPHGATSGVNSTSA